MHTTTISRIDLLHPVYWDTRRSPSNFGTTSASVEFWSRMIYDVCSALEVFTHSFWTTDYDNRPLYNILSPCRSCMSCSRREMLVLTRDVHEKNIKLYAKNYSHWSIPISHTHTHTHIIVSYYYNTIIINDLLYIYILYNIYLYLYLYTTATAVYSQIINLAKYVIIVI